MTAAPPPPPRSAAATPVDRLLKAAVDNSATELRLSGGVAPMLRIDGQMKPLKVNPISEADVLSMARAVAPADSELSDFMFTSVVGPCRGKLLDIQGTKVLVLEPQPEAPEESADDALDLELDPDALDNDDDTRNADGTPREGPRIVSGTIHIDKLLNAAVKNGVSDIHITTGLPPVFRIDGHMRPQKTKVLTADDTNGLMKSITPERCQI